MPNVAQGILITLAVFSFCFSLVFLLRFAALYAAFVKKEKEEENSPSVYRTSNDGEEARSDPKIYYIRATQNKPKRKRARKKTDVALKGIILRPEQFRRIRDERDLK